MYQRLYFLCLFYTQFHSHNPSIQLATSIEREKLPFGPINTSGWHGLSWFWNVCPINNVSTWLQHGILSAFPFHTQTILVAWDLEACYKVYKSFLHMNYPYTTLEASNSTINNLFKSGNVRTSGLVMTFLKSLKAGVASSFLFKPIFFK